MQQFLASLLLSAPFARVLSKPPFVTALLVMLALTLINDMATTWLKVGLHPAAPISAPS
jgi:hypothetical protein